jgi:hypothetical protein
VLLGLGWMLLGYAMWAIRAGSFQYRVVADRPIVKSLVVVWIGLLPARAGDPIPVSQPGEGRDHRPGH